MKVTDVIGWDKKGVEKVGFYMDGYLKENLDGIPKFLAKAYDCVGIISGMGKVRIGKCLKKGSKILLSNGKWKNVEEIKINDEVISPQEDGTITYERVTNLHNRFEKDCYDIIEEKSKKILYSCAGNHEVPVFKNNIKKGIYESKIIEAKNLSEFSLKAKNQFYCLSSPELEYKNREPKIDGYALGVWLGDGSFSSIRKLDKFYKGNKKSYTKEYTRCVNGKFIKHRGCFCNRKISYGKNGYHLFRSISITSDDKEIINEVSKYEKYMNVNNKKETSAKNYRYSVNGRLAKELIKYKLEGKGSGTKFIPKECLTASKGFRFRLLAGLIDTDGYVSKDNSIDIVTKSENLANDIKNLVFSLGGHSNITKITKRIKKNDFVGNYFSIIISFTDNTKIPLILKRKRDRLYKSKFNRNHVYIKCVKSSSSKVYGFSITGKSKFHITDNWMVTHNSSMAMQVGNYLAWRLAGGKIKCHQEIIKNKQTWITDKIIFPKKEVKFNLKENVVFSAEQMMKTADTLYSKYGPNQVIIYDEGRQGLDSARAMESVNKGMEDFFQECGFMGHVILIVLPNFFKLHEDYAIARSLFLINVYADKQFNRGYFSFYNEYQKEKLFYFGKKRIGVRAKYAATTHNFHGRFTSWSPFIKEEYDSMKKTAIRKKRQTRQQFKWKKQRDSAIYLLKKYSDISNQVISDELSVVSGQKISPRSVDYAISNITHKNVEEND